MILDVHLVVDDIMLYMNYHFGIYPKRSLDTSTFRKNIPENRLRGKRGFVRR